MEQVKCLKCGASLKELPNSAVEIQNPDLQQWLGNVCLTCEMVYCEKCIKIMGPTPCPVCGSATVPAIRMHLRKVRAVELIKKYIFGPEEWSNFFGDKFQKTNIPDVPWSKDSLEHPKINQKHFLFLGIDTLDGKPFDLLALYKLYPEGKHPKVYHRSDIAANKFVLGTCSFRWYHMPIGIVEGSLMYGRESYDNQLALLPDEYEVPSAIERAIANVLYYFLNKTYLDRDPHEVKSARTSDVTDKGDRVIMSAMYTTGLDIFDDRFSSSFKSGVSASRKLP